jgi:predicted nucleotide-binding protein
MAKAASANGKTDQTPEGPTSKSIRISQTVLPLVGLSQALRVAHAIWDELAGDGGRPLDVAAAMGMQPTGGNWKVLTGAAIAYGLTEGGYNASKIKLLPLGRRCVAPEEDGDDQLALVEAFLKPTLIKSFLDKYDGKKFPSEQIGANVIVSLGYPKERAIAALNLISNEAEQLGLIRTIKQERYVNLEGRKAQQSEKADQSAIELRNLGNLFADEADDNVVPITHHKDSPPPLHPGVRRVFITHGKDAGIRNQIEELIKFGNFEPVVSVKTESLAKPVPLKVLDEMRSCQAAVIHVNVEQRAIDQTGTEFDVVNQNVLIEIGAAMALYGDKFILLVEEGVALPSNLQGLYECRYSGSELSMTAAMKLLKAFNEFKTK